MSTYTPPCPHYATCGGCSLQHLAPEAYVEHKLGLVRQAFQAYGLDLQVLQVPIVLPPHTRRRCVLKALRVQTGVVLGYHERKSHQIVAINQCPLLLPELEALLSPLRGVLQKILAPKQKADIHLAASDTGVDMVLNIERLSRLDYNQTQDLIDFAREANIGRISYTGKDLVICLRQPTITYGGVPVDCEANGFMQASHQSDEILTNLAMPQGKIKRALDLFCGRGTYTLPLSNMTTVDAFELDEHALKALTDAKNKYSKPIITHRRNLFDEPLTIKELKAYDFAIINPPRAGALQQCRQLAGSGIPKITMVSCDPRTFARDAKVLVQGGYRLIKTTPVDQFLWSEHMELVGEFVCR